MKIDTSKIPNFDALPDEVKTALTGMEFADAPDMSGFVDKSVFDKKASEAADLAKKLKARMSEDEQKEAERAAKAAEVEAELAQLRSEKTISEHKANYIGLGYDEQLATDTAKALAAGDMEKVFANQKVHIENIRKVERASALAGDGKPPAGTDGAIDYAKQIADAQANSDYSAVAYFTRLSSTEAADNNT